MSRLLKCVSILAILVSIIINTTPCDAFSRFNNEFVYFNCADLVVLRYPISEINGNSTSMTTINLMKKSYNIICKEIKESPLGVYGIVHTDQDLYTGDNLYDDYN